MGADVLVWESAGRGSDCSATWSLLVHLAVRWAAGGSPAGADLQIGGLSGLGAVLSLRHQLPSLPPPSPADDGKLSLEEFQLFFADGVLDEKELEDLFHTIDSDNTK